MDEQNNNNNVISKYDRQRAGLQDVALWAKPSTIQVQDFTGRAETFVVTTARYEDKGDYIFIERSDEMLVRICLPPKVADLIARQRESLTTRRRRIAGQKRAAENKAAGILPGFMRGKKK